MLEMWLQLGLFVLVGLLAWRLSIKCPMSEYGAQPITTIDRWFLPVFLLMAWAVDELVSPMAQVWQGRFFSNHPSLHSTVTLWPWPIQVLVCLLVTDFLGYWFHRLMHTGTFWSVHALHHSSPSLNWFSGMRGSPLHMLLVIGPGTLSAAVFLQGVHPWAWFSVVLIEMLSQHFTHSNVHIPCAKQLEWWLVTPRMHFVHHHHDPRYGNSNYGFYFSFWDRLFGTYVDADDVPHRGPLGLSENYTFTSMLLGWRLKVRNEEDLQC